MDFVKSISVGNSSKIMHFLSCEIIKYSSEKYRLVILLIFSWQT